MGHGMEHHGPIGSHGERLEGKLRPDQSICRHAQAAVRTPGIYAIPGSSVRIGIRPQYAYPRAHRSLRQRMAPLHLYSG